MLVLTAKPTPTRLPMATDTLTLALGIEDTPMKVPKALATEMAVPMTGRRAQANGLLVLADGKMLPVLATQAMPSVVVDTLLLMLVLMPTATRMLTLLVMAMPLQLATVVMDLALTLVLADMVDGKLLSTLTLMLVLPPRDTSNTVLMALHGKMPMVTATLVLIPLDTALDDGAQPLMVQPMLMLARTASRTATSTVARLRMNTVMLTVQRMPVLADTADTKLMAVVPALLVTLPTSVAKALPSASVPLVEIVQLMLVEVAMAMNTLELLATLVRDMAHMALEMLILVVPAMLVMVQLVITETSQTLVPTAEEAMLLVPMVAPMAAQLAMALTELMDLVATADLLDMAELLVTADLLATTTTVTATVTDMAATVVTETTATETTATETTATIIQVPTDSAATLEMMVIMEMVIELSELSKQLLKEDTIPPMITCFKMCNNCKHSCFIN